MSNIETLIKNAVDNAEITDYIVLVRGKCFTLILVEDFIKDITLGGDAVCDTLLNCWKSMGQFDGGSNPENGDNNPCDCTEDFVKIHFPKGEGIKVITSDSYEYVPDSVYIKPKGTDKYQQIVVDEEGNVRTPEFPDFPEIDYPVVDGKSTSDVGVPIYDGLDTDKKIKILPVLSDTIMFSKKTTTEGKSYLSAEIPTSADDTIKSFYVNENYIGAGNGSILRPYNKYTNALKAVIGTGTLINPQYKNVKINLQSDVFVTVEDLIASPILEGRISVNTINVISESNYKIEYQGGIEYPVSTSFLKQKALSESYIGSVFMAYENVSLYSQSVKGIFHHETYEDSNISTTIITKDLSVFGLFNLSVYQLFSPSINFFGRPLRYQTNAISNSTPTVYFNGTNSIGLGNASITGYFKIIGTSQTFLKVENTAIAIDQLKIETNPFYVSIDNVTDKNPKAGTFRIEIYNGWLKTSIEDNGENYELAGGQDAYIRYYDDGSYPGSGLILDSGYVYRGRVNKALSINNSTEKILNLRDCSFNGISSIATDVYNERGTSLPERKAINIENCFFNKITTPELCGIQVNSTLSFINGSYYSTIPTLPDDTAALAAGLIPNNIYRVSSTGLLKSIGI
ncbi:hypothetical protein [Epilithonimonas sp.]|uniref:hypothetical protein n=1 Tax=Epilithonimonas sp. TaxID=2894511 RepID=UPI0035AD772C